MTRVHTILICGLILTGCGETEQEKADRLKQEKFDNEIKKAQDESNRVLEQSRKTAKRLKAELDDKEKI